MQITDEGYTIRQVPGVDKIEIVRDEASMEEVNILVHFMPDDHAGVMARMSFGIGEFEEFAKSAARVVSLALSMSEQNQRMQS